MLPPVRKGHNRRKIVIGLVGVLTVTSAIIGAVVISSNVAAADAQASASGSAAAEASKLAVHGGLLRRH
jgi:ssRNA-specific RNase YbeY (16S rRNA maturation enzyme)